LQNFLLLKASQGHNQGVMGLVRLCCPSQLMHKDSTRCGFIFFGSNILYKKHDEVQKKIGRCGDVQKLQLKRFFPLTLKHYEIMWMPRLALRFDPKLISPF
jgi:hypothetical protein